MGFEGLIKNEMPSFWKPSLSLAYSRISVPNVEMDRRPGQQLSSDQLKTRPKETFGAGYSCQRIAGYLRVSKATAWRMVHAE